MASVAEAFVTLRPDTDNFERESNSKIGGAIAGIAAKTVAAFSVAGTAAAVFGIKAAANFEQTTIAFEGILGSTEKAKTLLGQLRDFAAKTPFEFTGLADSAKQLLAVGFEAKDVIPTMTTLGNVAATLGVGEAEIAGVVRALGQMKGKGKASAEELQQISEQVPGFSAIKVIAEDMGITVAEAFKKMEKGQIPADAAIQSILRGMEKFPGAAGAMDRQSKTLNGVLSTLKDTVTGIAIDFITPYLPALAAGVTKFSGFLTNTLIPAIHRTVDFVKLHWPEIQAVIEDVLGRVQVVIGAVVDWLRAHWPEIKVIIADTVETARVVIVGFVDAVTTLWANFGDNIIAAVNKTWPPVRDTIAGILETIRGIVQTVTALIHGDWAEFWGGMKITTEGLGKAFVGSVKAVFELQNLAADIALEILSSAVHAAWEGIVNFVTDLPGRITSAASGMWDGIKDAFKDAINWIIRAWNGLEFKIPGFDPPGPGPSFGGFTLGVPNIPELHMGGIYKAPLGLSEGPAILRNGEEVTTPETMAGLGAKLDKLITVYERQTAAIVRLART